MAVTAVVAVRAAVVVGPVVLVVDGKLFDCHWRMRRFVSRKEDL